VTAVSGGHVRKRGKSWSYVLEASADPATGRRRQVWKGGFATKREAQKALREALSRVDLGTFVAPQRTTVAEYLDQWLETIKPSVRATTHAGYQRNVTKVKGGLGHVRLGDVRPVMIERLYAELAASGGRGGNPLSAKSVVNVHLCLGKAFADAERLGMLASNPVRRVRPPRWQSPEMRVWSAEQTQAFLDVSRDHRLHAAFVLLATTGMRRGEVVGLRWDDVHLEGLRLQVRHSVTTAENKIVVDGPKTRRSRRSIALDDDTVAALRRHRRRQAEERLVAGELWRDEGLVFPDELGALLHPDAVSRAFRALLRRAELPPIRLHDLRHGWASLALEAGVHPKVVSERLGHSTVGITLDTYSHVVQGLDADAAATVAKKLFSRSATSDSGGALSVSLPRPPAAAEDAGPASDDH
jgi:integrase